MHSQPIDANRALGLVFWDGLQAAERRKLLQIETVERKIEGRPELRAIGAFEGFMKGQEGYNCSSADDVPNELALGGFNWRFAITFGARALRPLGVGSVGIENDAIGGAFRNLAQNHECS